MRRFYADKRPDIVIHLAAVVGGMDLIRGQIQNSLVSRTVRTLERGQNTPFEEIVNTKKPFIELLLRHKK